MFPNYVLRFGRSILVLLCDDTNYETLVGMKKKGGGRPRGRGPKKGDFQDHAL